MKKGSMKVSSEQTDCSKHRSKKNVSTNQDYTGRNARRTMLWLSALMIGVVIIDQIIKFYVKTHFYLGEEFEIFSWMQIKFIENSGMAMGMNFIPKILLTLGRIVAVILLCMGMWELCKRKSFSKGFLVTMALICAGAAGNIFDCVFYGEIFNDPLPPAVAQLFPADGGYASWFHGKVVDMFYFPLFDFVWPEWIPFIGGNYFEFFSYIFNFADASISVGVLLLLIFYRNQADNAFSLWFTKKENESSSTK